MLNMIKLTVGCTSLDTLRERMQHERFGAYGVVHTRTMPKRLEELEGGSIFRVLDGMILCRQPIVGFETITRPDGSKGTLILVTDAIIPVEPRPCRPFQGWRYLKADDTPPDLATTQDGQSALPAALRRTLTELALL